MAEVRVRNLHFHYTPGVPVLRGIDLDLGPGATAIIGQNGAGKSTFVRLLKALLKPAEGEIRIDGCSTREVTAASLAATVGLVFQNPSDQLFKSRVLDEVMFGPLNLKVPLAEARERALVALREVGLEEARDRNPYDLGLAERKLVTVASILAMETDVVIFDEPTIAQDRAGVAELGGLVTRLKEAGRTVLTITHDMDFVAQYFERVLVFQEGRVLADGPAREIFADGGLLRSAGLEAPQITQLAHRLGWPETVLTVPEFVRLAQKE